MTTINLSSVHIDAVLTNISTAYMQEKDNFIADKVFLPLGVKKKSDIFYKYSKNDFNTDQMTVRADGVESAGSSYGLSTDTYTANVYALHQDLGDQLMANADDPLDPRRDATIWLTQKALIRKDVQLAADAFATSIWATDITGTASTTSATQVIQWSNFTTSNPIADIEDARYIVLMNTGQEGNVFVMGYKVFKILKQHPDIIDRIKYTTSEVPTEDLLAKLFGFDEVIVAKAVYNKAGEGQTGVFNYITGNTALVLHRPDSAGVLVPTAGYQFHWEGVSQGIGDQIGIKTWYNQDRSATRVEAQIAFTNKIVGTDLGYFFNTIVA